MEQIVACGTCGQIQRMVPPPVGSVAECCRCGAVIERRLRNSLNRAAAFAVAALIFYVPANIYPILRLSFYGAYSENTVWDGVMALARDGQWLVAAVVFAASILVPLLKLLVMFYLVIMARFKPYAQRHERVWLHRLLEVIGPWAMLDVFLVAILVSLVRLGELATIIPGIGLYAFTAVVVFTMFSTMSFDARSIWTNVYERAS